MELLWGNSVCAADENCKSAPSSLLQYRQGWPRQVHPNRINGLLEMGCGKVFVEMRFVLRLF